MEHHEYANLFPMMSADEHAALVASMKRDGYDKTAPIVLLDGKILDGRNRHRAAIDAQVTPTYTTYEGGDALQFVIRHNLTRRHLSSQQRAFVALELEKILSERAKEKEAERKTTFQKIEKSDMQPIHAAKQAAEIMQTNAQYVSDAKKIARELPEYVPLILSGDATIQDAKAELRQRARAEKVEEISAGNRPLEVGAKFNVICADPPWRYDFSKSDSREIENQYPTMSLLDICALPVKDIAADDCVLFLWTTSPKLYEAFGVLGAWGFEYKTSMIWDKEKIGMGYYARQQHEIILIATRGNLPVPEPTNRPASVIRSPRAKHSEKPDGFYQAIERMYPEYTKVELFAREPREGWQVWGNQV